MGARIPSGVETIRGVVAGTIQHRDWSITVRRTALIFSIGLALNISGRDALAQATGPDTAARRDLDTIRKELESLTSLFQRNVGAYRDKVAEVESATSIKEPSAAQKAQADSLARDATLYCVLLESATGHINVRISQVETLIGAVRRSSSQEEFRRFLGSSEFKAFTDSATTNVIPVLNTASKLRADAQTRAAIFQADCGPATPIEFPKLGDTLKAWDASTIARITVANQKGALKRIRDTVPDLKKLTDVNSNITAATNGFGAAIGDVSNAGVDGIQFAVSSALEMQLIKAPEQSWEVGSAFSVAGLSVSALGLVGTATWSDRSESWSNPKNLLPTLGSALGLAIAGLGQYLSRPSGAGPLREVVDRVATNRIVGLSIQELDGRIQEARRRLAAIPAPTITVPVVVSTVDDAAYIAEVGNKIAALEANSTAPLQDGDIKKLETLNGAWITAATNDVTSARGAWNTINDQMNNVAERVDAFATVVSGAGSAVRKVRDLIDDPRRVGAGALCTATYTCADKTTTDAKAFCELRPSGASHFVASLLSDEGMSALFNLGACNLKLYKSASTSLENARAAMSQAVEQAGIAESRLRDLSGDKMLVVKSAIGDLREKP